MTRSARCKWLRGFRECQAVSTVSKREVDQDEFQEILEEQGLPGQKRRYA